MKTMKNLLMIVITVILVACSNDESAKIVGESPNDELKATFAFENKIYSINRGITLEKDLDKKLV